MKRSKNQTFVAGEGIARKNKGPTTRGFDKRHVFVSYARVNEMAVQTIVSRLRAWGYTVWLDQYDIEAGETWRERLVNAIKQADAFLLMISPAAAHSRMVAWELSQAEQNKIRVIPVIIQSATLPASLRRRLEGVHHVSFLKDRFRGATALVEALGGVRGGIPKIPGDTKYPAIRENARMMVEILRFLQDVSRAGGNGIFYGGTDWAYYIQFAVYPHTREVYAEAVGDTNLRKPYRLSAEQVGKLKALGWEDANETSAGNFRKTWEVRLDNDRALAVGEVMRTFLEVFSHYKGEHLKIELHLHH